MSHKTPLLSAVAAALLLGASSVGLADTGARADQEPPINIEAGGTHLEDGITGTPETKAAQVPNHSRSEHGSDNRSDVSVDSMSNRRDPLPNDGDQLNNKAF
ncbi:hypothetical protein [Salinisphaera sp. T31B1]|uniref:hypothetical protein n=1 Tax=Salinisphaera sp. T31B1 TaxID=727963 RepID=UPI0033402B92